MNSIINLGPTQLRRAADLQEKILTLQSELIGIMGASLPMPAAEAVSKPKDGRKKRRKLSPQALANIRAGVAKRMAKKGLASKPGRKQGKRKMTAAGRAAISAAAKARWAKAKAQGKSRL
jgi:hypothetical protein